jgi:hypothetical protein
MIKKYCLGFLFLFQVISTPSSQSPLNKTTAEIAALRGNNFRKMADGGHLVYHFQRDAVAKFGSYTISEFLYFDHDTCYKDVTILPRYLMNNYIDSFNRIYKPVNTQAWRGPDSSFISISLRDALLDVTSFSASYYNKNSTGQ